MSASVVVCTRNRVDHLRRCLASLERQLDVDERTDVVVVDNGSADGTAELLQQWSATEPARRRVVHEARPGLSMARNVGVAATPSSDVVAFLDDDAVAPRGWLAAHLRCYDTDPAVDAVGGPVVLAWPQGRPAWVTPRLEHWWSALDAGDDPGLFPRPHGPYGTNMSIRRPTLLAVGQFRTCLGRRGASLISGEEAAVWAAVWERGGVIRYEPATLVVHEVVAGPASARVRRRWVLRRGIAQGLTNARLAALATPRPAGAVVAACRDDARWLFDQSGDVIRSVFGGGATSSDVLDDIARRSGHAAAIAEHVRLRLLDAIGVDWRNTGAGGSGAGGS
ncbi:MAG: glycosyltransferase family A protein [Ilumatobacteraceae bacterium]